jgi:hypothetical protein
MSNHALCEWCNKDKGVIDLSPPEADYTTLICPNCYERLHTKILEYLIPIEEGEEGEGEEESEK